MGRLTGPREDIPDNRLFFRNTVVITVAILMLLTGLIFFIYNSVREDRMTRHEQTVNGQTPMQVCTATGGSWDGYSESCHFSKR